MRTATLAALVALLAPATAGAGLLEPGSLRLGLGLGAGSGVVAAGLELGYVVNPHVVPGVRVSGRLVDGGPNTGTTEAGVTFYLSPESSFIPYAEGWGGRLFVGDGLDDAWKVSVGAGVLMVLGTNLGLSIGVSHDRYSFDDGSTFQENRPTLGIGLFL